MSLYKLFGKFWDTVKIGDDKRIAGLSFPDGIKEVCNIEYTSSGSEYHKLDLYYPENTDKPLPVIIDIHGGGWMYATKDLNKIYCEYLAKRGFAVFNLSYRLVPEVTVPEQLVDISEALAKIAEIMPDYPCDTKNIMLTGDSAGGQLAAYTAAISENENIAGHFDTKAHGLHFSRLVLTSPVSFMNSPLPIAFYCRTMWGEKWHSMSTKKYMDADELLKDCENYPDTLLVTSSGDYFGHAQTRRLYKTLLENSFMASLADFPKFEGQNLPHVFAVVQPTSKAGEICIDKTCEFFKTGIK